MEQRQSAGRDSSGASPQAGAAGQMPASGRFGPGAAGAGATRPTPSRLWTLDAEGHVVPVRVRPGISDGQYTEVSGRNVEEGMEVIAGLQSRSSASSSTASPFQPQGGRNFRGPPPF